MSDDKYTLVERSEHGVWAAAPVRTSRLYLTVEMVQRMMLNEAHSETIAEMERITRQMKRLEKRRRRLFSKACRLAWMSRQVQR
jgi:hypothetical protein